ncbi:DUF1394-domain-containing protein [Hesseltinella vesiculosa]|uniref:DUF1394-domain-containing protein n=1 Tax=Hesseltinella vesiculosa TaxID=101127 RepID=A0A1X2GEF4_9FUNG|nr:DUF1394-domain-containing protein [Hesseltinella vesiculosa]
MGQILTSLSSFRSNEVMVPELGFDIENASPSSEEMLVYHELSAQLVAPTTALLHALQNYRSSSEVIRSAIASPTPENENIAWNSVLPTVNMLQKVFEYAENLRKGIPRLLNILCQGDVNSNLQTHQGLTKLFADVLDFVFEFDHLKMRNSTLQNDFSYYRRMLQRGRYSTSSDDNTSDLRSAMLEDDLANQISLFIAYPTPMLRCVIDTTTDYVTKNRLQKGVGECLAAVWASCFYTVHKKKAQRPEMSAFFLKVMVVTIILYDHIDPNGVFTKQSPINIKNSVKMIQTISTLDIPTDSSASNLMSALRYNSKHLNDDKTPKGVRNMVLAA